MSIIKKECVFCCKLRKLKPYKDWGIVVCNTCYKEQHSFDRWAEKTNWQAQLEGWSDYE